MLLCQIVNSHSFPQRPVQIPFPIPADGFNVIIPPNIAQVRSSLGSQRQETNRIIHRILYISFGIHIGEIRTVTFWCPGALVVAGLFVPATETVVAEDHIFYTISGFFGWPHKIFTFFQFGEVSQLSGFFGNIFRTVNLNLAESVVPTGVRVNSYIPCLVAGIFVSSVVGSPSGGVLVMPAKVAKSRSRHIFTVDG